MTKRFIEKSLLLLISWLVIACAAGRPAGVASQRQAGPVFDITAYGAVNDPKVSSSDAFRRAIADCRKAGGVCWTG